MQTDDRNGHFLATMPIHQAFVDEKAYLASIGKELDEGGKKDGKNVHPCDIWITIQVVSERTSLPITV